ncbi:protein transport protein Sec24C-like [Watersipora subatra]|uniref:protein transport protein Sec24C-like n=1 Tax=Watersipora subatra TaxID=2589382 RepID=UPI00355C5ECA
MQGAYGPPAGGVYGAPPNAGQPPSHPPAAPGAIKSVPGQQVQHNGQYINNPQMNQMANQMNRMSLQQPPPHGMASQSQGNPMPSSQSFNRPPLAGPGAPNGPEHQLPPHSGSQPVSTNTSAAFNKMLPPTAGMQAGVPPTSHYNGPPTSNVGPNSMPPTSLYGGQPNGVSAPLPGNAGNQPQAPGQLQQPGLHLPQPGAMHPPQPGMPARQPGMLSQPGMPGQLPQPGMPGQPPQPGMPGQPPQPGMSGQPPQPGMPGQPPQPGMPGQPPQSGMLSQPPRPGMLPPQPGMTAQPPQHGMQPPQPGMIHPSQPGMPSQPPQPGMMGSSGGANYMNSAPAPKRLDPDTMPSPIQVIMDDIKMKSGVFQTAQRGVVPPLVTTDFTCQDQGNCNPRYLRSTMYSIPNSSEMMKQCKMPFAVACTPYAKIPASERPPPLVNLGELGPVRCRRCRAYMSPHMQFIDGGRRFSCPYCTCATDVPQEYFAHLDHTGRRVDTYERPELCLGSYEFVATKDYCKNSILPGPPAFIFMIDVSYNSVKSGLVHLLCQHLREDILPHLPKEQGMEESEIKVGFVTYTNVLHFYNVLGNLVQPQMMVVGDVKDVFVPMVDGFLVNLSESDSVIQSLLEQLPEMFAESRETSVVLGPVIQAGLDALKSAGCPGKLFVFHTSLPTADAPGVLQNRDDRKLLGTEKENTILTPAGTFYSSLGQECVTHGCGVDLFLFPNSYIDIATIREVPRMTGGDIYRYEYFTADSHGTRFINDLKSAVSKQIAFDCIVRVRTSTGIRPVDFVGNFYMSNTTDVEMAVVDSDKTFCCEIKHDDKLNEGDGVYVQVAMLFTSITGQRRLRIHNLSLNVCSLMTEMFKNVEQDTLINFLSKTAVRDQLEKTPKVVRERIMTQCAEILACYRRNCANPSSAGQLILPESMKLLPLYTNCIIKSDALQAGSDISTDGRGYLMHLVMSLDVNSSVPFFYPRLLPLHTLDVNSDALPTPIRCSTDRLLDTGAYLLENGLSMFLWLGYNLNQEFIQDVFGVGSLAQINIETCILLELDNPRSQRINQIVSKVRSQRSRFMKLTIVRQRDKLEPWFNHFLVEDKGTNGSPSYVDYLCHIHKEIRAGTGS